MAEPDAVRGGGAVLHHLPDPHPGVEDDPRRRKPGHRIPPHDRARSERAHPVHRLRGDRRYHLQLPPLHGAAALRKPRADRHQGLGGVERPLRERLLDLLESDLPALTAGRRRRHAAHLHPRGRRLRQRGIPRRRQQLDDRQRHPKALPDAIELLFRRRALVRPDGGDHGRRDPLHQSRRLRGADGTGGRMSATPTTTTPGRGSLGAETSAARAWRWLREHAVNIVAVLVLIYLLIPIVLIFVFSFNNPAGRYNFTWVGFTLKHWSHPFHDTELTKALLESIKLALLATAISTIIGTMMALALVRHNFLGRRVANVLIVVPMATPEVVMGASLLSFFLILGTSRGFKTLLIAHVMFCISFVVVVVRSRLIGFDRSLEEAAKDLGANSFTTFRLVTFPLILPGIFGAAMLAFALSIDDFVISNFNAGTTVTFPLYIFGAAQRGIPVEVYVVAMILFFATVVAMGFATWQQRRAEKMTAIRPEQEGSADVAVPGIP